MSTSEIQENAGSVSKYATSATAAGSVRPPGISEAIFVESG